jgi:hypothetical protein
MACNDRTAVIEGRRDRCRAGDDSAPEAQLLFDSVDLSKSQQARALGRLA